MLCRPGSAAVGRGGEFAVLEEMGMSHGIDITRCSGNRGWSTVVGFVVGRVSVAFYWTLGANINGFNVGEVSFELLLVLPFLFQFHRYSPEIFEPRPRFWVRFLGLVPNLGALLEASFAFGVQPVFAFASDPLAEVLGRDPNGDDRECPEEGFKDCHSGSSCIRSMMASA